MRNNRRFRPLFVLGPLALLFLVSGIVMWLWNWILPAVIGVKAVTYFQAMGILVLSKILFGGFHGGFGRKKCRGFGSSKCDEKFENVSSEEREKFREMMRERYKDGFFCKK